LNVEWLYTENRTWSANVTFSGADLGLVRYIQYKTDSTGLTSQPFDRTADIVPGETSFTFTEPRNQWCYDNDNMETVGLEVNLLNDLRCTVSTTNKNRGTYSHWRNTSKKTKFTDP